MTNYKTLIIPRCYPFQLRNLPYALENLILVRIYVNHDNCKLNNLPVTLKTLIIGDVIGDTESTKLFYNNVKLPFGCVQIQGALNSPFNFVFTYINNDHDFLDDTIIVDKYIFTNPRQYSIYQYTTSKNYYFYLND
jgi:hypothetical protein